MPSQSPDSTNENGTYKFPTFSADYKPRDSSEGHFKQDDLSLSQDGSPAFGGQQPWMPRRDTSRNGRWSGGINGAGSSSYGKGKGMRHNRQKSLSEAITTIRNRRASVTQNAKEIADALKAPVSPALVVLFSIWYFASVMSSTSSKQVLLAFPKPVTLTIIQFVFVSSWCLFLSFLSKKFSILRRLPALKNGIKKPTREIIMTTLPLTGFMIGGHILSSDAISRMDVSLVHTIKGLSPLFTVAAYRFFFHVRYSVYTYLSLIPLTIGVILACSTNFRANFLGLMSAFASAILFVTQNIVSKRIFNAADLAEKEPGATKKPDKLNLLCYSSLLALAMTFPIWLWSEGWVILVDFFSDASIELSGRKGSFDHGRLALEYLFNGTFHFTQSLTAFVLLSMVSPVTYSVASLVKRVFVIVFSIIWFGNRVTQIQGYGIALTFLGLYLYDRTSDAARADRRARLNQPTGSLLPLVEKSPPPDITSFRQPLFQAGSGLGVVDRRSPELKGELGGTNGWLPAGTKAEDTWTRRDGS